MERWGGDKRQKVNAQSVRGLEANKNEVINAMIQYKTGEKPTWTTWVERSVLY